MATRVVTVTSLADIQANDRIIRSISHADGRIEATVERSVPEVEPGTVGTATVRGIEGVQVVRTSRTVANNRDVAWFTPIEEQIGGWWHREDEVTSFVPDPDTAALRAEVERLLGALRSVPGYTSPETFRRAVEDLVREREGWRTTAMTNTEHHKRALARAAAAESRLRDLTGRLAFSEDTLAQAREAYDAAASHAPITVGLAAAVRRVLALVAADEQATPDPWPFAPGDVVRDSGPEGDDAAWLDAAPEGTVVRDEEGDDWTRTEEAWVWSPGNGPAVLTRDSAHLAEKYAPLTVVSVGGAS